jgi:hypothetical protein
VPRWRVWNSSLAVDARACPRRRLALMAAFRLPGWLHAWPRPAAVVGTYGRRLMLGDPRATSITRMVQTGADPVAMACRATQCANSNVGTKPTAATSNTTRKIVMCDHGRVRWKRVHGVSAGCRWTARFGPPALFDAAPSMRGRPGKSL